MKNHFTLWLEFEEVKIPDWDPRNSFSTIRVDLGDGRRYGINVWTYQFLNHSVARNQDGGNNLNGKYEIPPDLLVEELSRRSLEAVVSDLLLIDDLEKVLNPTIIIEE